MVGLVRSWRVGRYRPLAASDSRRGRLRSSRLVGSDSLGQALFATPPAEGAGAPASTLTCHAEENVRHRLSVPEFMDSLRSSGVDTGGPKPYGPREKREFASALAGS